MKCKPKFKVGQVVAFMQDGAVVEFFRIGAIDRIEKGIYWYTKNESVKAPFYTERTLRPLTKREAGR